MHCLPFAPEKDETRLPPGTSEKKSKLKREGNIPNIKNTIYFFTSKHSLTQLKYKFVSIFSDFFHGNLAASSGKLTAPERNPAGGHSASIFRVEE
jgi:hypothetical protein